MELTEEVIAQLRQKYGDDLIAFPAIEGELVFRKPTLGEFNRFLDESDAKDTKTTRSVALRNEAASCFVWPTDATGAPDRAALNRAIDLEPGIPLMVIDDLNKMAGVSESKKARSLKKL